MEEERKRILKMIEQGKISPDEGLKLLKALETSPKITTKSEFEAVHPKPSQKILRNLYNPFLSIAGGKALVIGILIILLSSVIGWYCAVHFDGAFDLSPSDEITRTGKLDSYYLILFECLIAWLSIAFMFFILGTIFSKKKQRVIDYFGFTAIARFPYLLGAIVSSRFWLEGYFEKIDLTLDLESLKELTESLSRNVGFISGIVLILLIVIWFCALNFFALKESSGLSTGKTWPAFIGGSIMAEIISKMILTILAGTFVISPFFGKIEEIQRDSIPWGTKEITVYNWMTKTGLKIGETIYKIELKDAPEGKIYQITSSTSIDSTRDETTVIVSAKDLSPISVHRTIENPEGKFDFKGTYKNQQLKIIAITPDGTRTYNLDLPKYAYDNEESLFLIRAFPLKKDYVHTFVIAVVATGSKGECILKVISEEKIKVPAGEFDTYKVELGFVLGGLKHYAWYSKEKPNYLIKYDNGNIICELNDF
ncbi:MAG: DUF3108 domain-containing protein [Candidatus Aminicenantia bacterium]